MLDVNKNQEIELFLENRQLIGEGKMAKVYQWNGFAYKCFHASYPKTWLDYEMDIQRVIVNTYKNAPFAVVNYEMAEWTHMIKMDWIRGKTLTDKMRRERYKDGVADLIELFDFIHEKESRDLPLLKPYLEQTIRSLAIDSEVISKLLEILNILPEGNAICHLDLHPDNLLVNETGYTVIDWVNAKSGHPLYDYARTYVILYEHAFRLSAKYLTEIKKKLKRQKLTDENQLYHAIAVMTAHRLTETDSEKVKILLKQTLEQL